MVNVSCIPSDASTWWIVDGVVETSPRTRVMLDLHERGKALAEVGEVSEQYEE